MDQRRAPTRVVPARVRGGGGFRFGDWQVWPDQKAIEREGLRLVLEPKIVDVLQCLAEHAGEVVSADQLLVECWRGAFYGDNPVHKAIAVLRKALGDQSQEPRYIATIRKRGYRVLVPVAFADEPARGAQPLPPWPGGSPYRGLEPFDERHAEVYFGRSRAVGELLGALREQRAAGCAFLLLVGPSGCGKTSLVRAGLLPMLGGEAGFEGVALAAVAQVDAKAGGAGIADALARGLGQWRHAGMPLFPDAGAASLRRTLLERPEALLERIEAALARDAGGAARGLRQELLLVIDQWEGMLAGSPPSECAAVVRALDELARSGRVTVIALCRSDFYAALLEVPGVAELKRGAGHYDVPPPTPGEIAQMIRKPARAAGLGFDQDPHSQAHLDDVLRDAAAATPGSLPLLQYVLDELYRRRDERGVLSFAAYREIGGLEGSLGRRAEQVYAGLARPAQAALFPVLQALAVLPEGEAGVLGRRLPLARFADPQQRALIDRFVDARLFVAEDLDGEPCLSVVHEALFRHWQRVRAWAERNHALLRVRTRLAERARRWREEGRRHDLLLAGGLQLAEAQPLLAADGLTLDDEERAFLLASIRRDAWRRRLRLGAIAAIGLLAAGASAAALWAWRAQGRAEQRRVQAEGLVNFMLGDLTARLRPLSRLDVLEAVSAKVLAQLAALPAGDRDAASLLQRATALRQIADIRFEQADLAAAEPLLAQAQALLGRAAALQPPAPALDAEQGQISYLRGAIAYRRQDLAAAQRHWQAYRDAAERQLAAQPRSRQSWLELSYALNNLGTLAEARGEHGQAAEAFTRSIELKRKALAAAPAAERQELEADLADSLSWLATAREAQGRPLLALPLYREQSRRLAWLLAASKDAPAWRYRLVQARLRFASLAAALGEPAAAIDAYRQAEQALRSLTAGDPARLTWQRDLAYAQIQRGWTQALEGHTAEGESAVGAGVAAIQALLARADTPEWRRLAALGQGDLARLAAQRGALGQAGELAAAAAHTLEALHARRADDRRTAAALAEIWTIQGEIQAAQGDRAGAQARWQRAAELLAAQAEDSSDRHVLDPWIRVLDDLGRAGQAEPYRSRLAALGYRLPALPAPLPPTGATRHE